MPFKGQQGVVTVHSVPIIGDADQFAAACLNLDPDAGSSGVQGILQQLFDHRCWTVDHLAGGDLVGHLVMKNADASHSFSEYPTQWVGSCLWISKNNRRYLR